MSAKLSEQENLYLKSIKRDLTPLHVKILMEDLDKHEDLELSTAYAVRIALANQEAYEEAISMMNQETYEFFDRIGVKTGMKDRWKEEGKVETALKMLQDELPAYKIAEYVEMSVAWVESLME